MTHEKLCQQCPWVYKITAEITVLQILLLPLQSFGITFKLQQRTGRHSCCTEVLAGFIPDVPTSHKYIYHKNH